MSRSGRPVAPVDDPGRYPGLRFVCAAHVSGPCRQRGRDRRGRDLRAMSAPTSLRTTLRKPQRHTPAVPTTEVSRLAWSRV